MPATREQLYQQIGMAYFSLLPTTQQTKLERAFESYRDELEEGVRMTIAQRQANQPAPEPTARPGTAPSAARPNVTQRINTALAGNPTGYTVRQVMKLVPGVAESTINRILTQGVTTGAVVKEGAKYRMTAPSTGLTPTTGAANPPMPSSTRTRIRNRSKGGTEPSTDRVFDLVRQRPGITKAEVIAAMAPARANHTGIWLARLCKSGRITGAAGGKDGPYYPSTAQRAAA